MGRGQNRGGPSQGSASSETDDSGLIVFAARLKITEPRRQRLGAILDRDAALDMARRQ